MGVPQTYLLTTPDIKDDPFGRAIASSDLIKGLKKINPLILVDEQYSPGVWYPGKHLGMTCLWFRQIRKRRRKISAFTPGAVPEWTQLDDQGRIIVKGWRAIFSKVMKIGAASKLSIERVFHVDLGVDGKSKHCSRCLRSGKIKEVWSASGFCNMHERIRRMAWLANQAKDEAKYQQRKGSICPSLVSQGKSSTEASPTAPMSASSLVPAR